MSSAVPVREVASAGEDLRDVTEFEVGFGAGLDQDLERLIGGELEAFHQNAFGLPDDVSTVDRDPQLLLASGGGHRYRGVRGEQQPDLFGLVAEGPCLPGVHVQGS